MARVVDFGPTAVLIDDVDVARVAAVLLERRPAGVIDVVPGDGSVVVDVERPEDLDHLRTHLRTLLTSIERDRAPVRRTVTLGVRFDGPDLADVAARIGWSEGDVVESIAGSDLEVAFCGFAPGFAYLTGVDPVLHLPRRATPRTRVPAGSFAVAAGYAAVYPGASPGGWHLLGSVDEPVWDADRDPPAALVPGTRVVVEVLG